jgi:hypothetical protein
VRLAALLLLLASCKVANELYCDGMTPCPVGYSCDLNPGSQQNGCVLGSGADAGPADSPVSLADAAPPDAILCADAGSAVCPDPFPICRAGVCGACAENLDCPVTSPVCNPGGCDPCALPGDCADRTLTPNCLTATGACVQCRNDNGDCGGVTPICENTACRACRMDAECAEICDTDTGRCVARGEILYVKPGGTGTTCMFEAPCGSITATLAKVSVAKPWIELLAGTYVESFVVKDQPLRMVGVGASVQPNGADPVVWVQGTADVLIRNVRFHEGANANADGIRCDGIGAASTKVRGFDLRIDNNLGAGVNASRCTVVLERSRLFRNAAGGLRLFDTTFAVRNNFIAQNGTLDQSTVGGFRLLSAPPGLSIFDFNTVAGNRSRSDTAPGVQCDAALTMSSDIVWGNGSVPDVTAQLGGVGPCAFTTSDIGGPTAPVPPSINANPEFHDAGGDDYHLNAGSPCGNAGHAGPGDVEDIDGQPRPKPGTAADIGADEAF